MKIGYLYYTFYPVTGGASVHGFYLARELKKAGYKLFKLNGEDDPYTKKLSSFKGALWILWNCDLIYSRVDYFPYRRNFFTALAILAGKKVVVELNSPSDELKLFGKSSAYIRRVDKIMSWFLKKACAVVVVSDPIKKYCQEELGLSNVTVIENGGEEFHRAGEKATERIKKRAEEICRKYPVRVVWSGSVNKMQNMRILKKVANADPERVALFILAKYDEGAIPNERGLLQKENVFDFEDLPRRDVEYLISISHAGLAFYEDYTWCRWGFYNSSLKIFEYLNNGLITVTNTPGTLVQQQYSTFRQVTNEEDIVKIIRDLSLHKTNSSEKIRTWSDVGKETADILNQIGKRC